jgi:hypothetical protein
VVGRVEFGRRRMGWHMKGRRGCGNRINICYKIFEDGRRMKYNRCIENFGSKNILDLQSLQEGAPLTQSNN